MDKVFNYRLLVEMALANLGTGRFVQFGGPLRQRRYALAMELFGMGSTSARRLVSNFGHDPDEYVGALCPDESTNVEDI